MELRKIMKCLIVGFMGSALLFSCSSEEFVGEVDNEKTEFLTTSSEQNVCLNINYDVPEGYKVLFDVYAENPYEISGEGIGMKNIAPIISGMTDDKGEYHVSRIISGGVQEVYVLSRSVGAPALLHGKIESGKVTPVEFDLSAMVSQESSDESRSASASFLYLGDWNSWGRPNYIDGSKSCNLSSKEWRTVSQALPEWKKVNPDCTEIDFIYVKQEAEIWVSLLSAKSLFNNALGYYCYEEGMTKNDITEVIALPRTDISLLNNKGLKAGQYVKLKYLNPKTQKFEDKFPAGSRIGWVLHRSGFRCLTSKVENGNYQFYSNSDWNSEKKNKEHTAIFSTSEGNVILGFEDLYNDVALADNDCNDVVFHIETSPKDAVIVDVEIPDATGDVVEEDVDVVQPLESIIDVPEYDRLANDLVVASKSTLEVEDGFVVGVKDVFYIATSAAMDNMITQTYTASEMERKVVVRTTVKFARAAEEGTTDKETTTEKKGRTVVRTTVKNTTWEVEEAAETRAAMYFTGDVSQLIMDAINANRQKLADGKCIRLEVIMQIEGVEYNKFVESINLPPYTPFIVNVNE